MQKRTIFIMGLLAIFAIVIAGSASAVDLSSLLGDSSSDDASQVVTVEGLNFTIPDGYTESVENSFENVTQSAGGLTFTMNGKTFEKGSDAVAIMVADYGEYKVTDDILKQVSDDKKTIAGQKGYVKVDNGFTVFSYVEDGDLVTISASDESVIEEILS